MGDKARWEVPVGHLDGDEKVLTAAVREFSEETGVTLPKGAKPVGTVLSEDGKCQIFVFTVDHEDDIEFGTPDGEEISGASWWDVDDLDDDDVRDKLRDELDSLEPLLEQAAKDARGYELSARSGMVSLDVPPGTVPVMAGGIDDHHITIVYLGKDVDDEVFEEVCAVVRAIASTTSGPLTGTLSGIGSFPASDSSDGMIPVFVNPDVPGIEALRAPLDRFNASEHKQWSPHVTLCYLDEGDPMPEPLGAVPVSFNGLTVHRGPDVAHFYFRGCEPQGSVYQEAQAVAKRYLTYEDVLRANPDVEVAQVCASSEEAERLIADDVFDGSEYKAIGNCIVVKANPFQHRGQHGLWRPTPRWEDFHQHTDRIVNAYVPLIEEAMSEVVPRDAIQRALAEAYGGMVKATLPAVTTRTTPPTTPVPPAGLTPNQAAAVAAAALPFASAVVGAGATAVAVTGGLVSIASAAAAVIALLTGTPLALGALTVVLTSLYGHAAVQGAHEAADASRGVVPPTIADSGADGVPTDVPQLAAERDKWVREIGRTQIARIGNAIRFAIEHGQTLDEARAAVDAIVHDTTKAKQIAQNEFSRAYAAAAEVTYRVNAVAELRWLARPDACVLCKENEAASPQPMGAPTWPNGPPLVHVNCRCLLVPA